MFNVNFWTPEGVYVCHDPYLREGYTSTDIIEDRLKHGSRELSNGIRISAAESVRFAPKETYKPGEHTPDSLAKDGFMIASFGEEGAQKIAEVISRNNSSGNISVYRPVPANSLPHPRNRNETFSFIDLDTDNKRFDLLGHNPCEWMTGYAFASL